MSTKDPYAELLTSLRAVDTTLERHQRHQRVKSLVRFFYALLFFGSLPTAAAIFFFAWQPHTPITGLIVAYALGGLVFAALIAVAGLVALWKWSISL